MKQAQFSTVIVRYVIGFGSAMTLSVLSYLMVAKHWVESSYGTMALLLAFATTQLVVQLVCFLHLNMEGRTRNRTLSFMFTVAMMLIIVIGSLWIMNNLDYRMRMSGEAMNEYMKAQNKKGF